MQKGYDGVENKANYSVTKNVEHITNYSLTRNIENITNLVRRDDYKETEQKIYTEYRNKTK